MLISTVIITKITCCRCRSIQHRLRRCLQCWTSLSSRYLCRLAWQVSASCLLRTHSPSRCCLTKAISFPTWIPLWEFYPWDPVSSITSGRPSRSSALCSTLFIHYRRTSLEDLGHFAATHSAVRRIWSHPQQVYSSIWLAKSSGGCAYRLPW